MTRRGRIYRVPRSLTLKQLLLAAKWPPHPDAQLQHALTDLQTTPRDPSLADGLELEEGRFLQLYLVLKESEDATIRMFKQDFAARQKWCILPNTYVSDKWNHLPPSFPLFYKPGPSSFHSMQTAFGSSEDKWQYRNSLIISRRGPFFKQLNNWQSRASNMKNMPSSDFTIFYLFFLGLHRST